MSDAETLNRALAAEAPAALRCLSPLGLRAVLPRGIPWQSAQAAGTAYNATIGQITDGHGRPMPLPALGRDLEELDPKLAFLYSPLAGHPALRERWAARQRRLSGGSEAPSTVAVVTHGLTQAISHVAALFADPDTDVLIPEPTWGNYRLVFTLHAGARLVTYPFYRDGRFNVEGLADALARVRGKAIAVLNFPSNPSGYTPTPAEVARLVDVVAAHPGPLVALVDDAYAGLVFEPECAQRSVYWDLIERVDPERTFVVRADGSTKELLFFSGRVGFLSHPAGGAAAEALQAKALCVARGTVGAPPGPSQAVVLDALADPDLEAQIADRVALLGRRYRALRQALEAEGGAALRAYPHNSGCFTLVQVDERVPVEPLRLRLIAEDDVGIVSFPAINAIRLAYCSMDEGSIPEVVARVRAAVARALP